MQLPPSRDENLRQFATDKQWEILEAIWQYGSIPRAMPHLKVDKALAYRQRDAVLWRAAKQGYAPDQHHHHIVPDGYKLRGTSTLYDGDGTPRLQWVKTTEDSERQAEFLREMVATLAEDIPRLKPVRGPKVVNDDLLAVYPIGDHHLGMYAWAEEAGEDYDLSIAETLLERAMQSLVASSEPCGQSLVAVLGDFFHYDGLDPVTPTSKNLLDSDGRFAKMVRVGIRLIRRVIDLALSRHAKVRVIIEAGNHDLSSMVFMAECMAALYERDERVTVDTVPNHFHYHHFGSTLIGVHHGHGAKLEQLPLIMAADQPEAWGQSQHRYWYTGHTHKDRVLDIQGVRVESFRVLPPKDAWAAGKGYRSARSMTAITIHKKFGEADRRFVKPEMFA